jgi:hypothetical protein
MNKCCFSLLLALTWPAAADADAAYKGLDGNALLRMCQGADKVRALSVMCHNYLNGYLDAAHHFSPRLGFCMGEGDKEKLPAGLVAWLKVHADKQKLPAGQVVDLALQDLHPCKGQK